MQQGRGAVYGDTHVFWDMVDFPLPDEVDIDSLKQNIESYLRDEGYVGETRIAAYGHTGDLSSSLILEFIHPAIILRPLRGRYARVTSIMLDMLNISHYMSPPANVMLITKRIPEEDTELVRVLKEMIKRDYNVVLVVENEQHYLSYDSELQSSATGWLWKDLVFGEGHIPDDDDEEDDDEEEGIPPHKRHKMID